MALFAFASSIALGADLTGKWTATSRMPDGSDHQSTFDLKTEGRRITGKIFSRRGAAEISEGTIEGNRISFVVVRKGNGAEFRIEFTGTLDDETMNLAMRYRNHNPVQIVAKRS